MDNADLERLSVSPGQLSPAFHKDTVEYDTILGSEVAQLKLTLLTSDSGASYTIKVRWNSYVEVTNRLCV
jgi:hypothetical protein